MFEIKVNGQEPIGNTKEAKEFEIGEVFKDSDGDLHLRLAHGCLTLRQEGLDYNYMSQYTEEEIKNTGSLEFFAACELVECSATILVNI